jgi:hypothetical protein
MGAEMIPSDIKALRHHKAGTPTAQYPYRSANGEVVLIANRFDRAGGGKFFLPYCVFRGDPATCTDSIRPPIPI